MATLINNNKDYRSAVATLNGWAYEYYTNDNSIVIDAVYDELYFTVKNYEDSNPSEIMKTSPTQRVGDVVLTGFTKAQHLTKMYSLDDVFFDENSNHSEFREWAQKIKNEFPNVIFYAEPKYDGLSLNMKYENGVLVQAITRGDGEEGEDVTKNVSYIKGIPLNIEYKGKVEIRGEVTIFKADFDLVNQYRLESGKDEFTNERGAAAGSLRSFNSKAVKAANLRFSPYAIGNNDLNIDSQSAQYDWIISQGFTSWGTREHSVVHDSIDGVITDYDRIMETRNQHPMLLDGVVIKVDQKSIQDELGFTTKYPKWAIAYKFPALEVETTLNNIILQVGKTGAITPVAIIEPTLMDGVTVERATLHNFAEIERKDIRIHDRIFLIRSGDVIPKIISSNPLVRTGKEIIMKKPTHCPECGAEAEHRIGADGEPSTVLYCSSDSCPAQIRENIAYAIGKKALNMFGLGDSAAEELVNKKIISEIPDLFKLTKEDLLSLDGFKDKKVEKALNAIQSAIGTDFYRFVNALDIETIGERASKKLSKEEFFVDLILGKIDTTDNEENIQAKLETIEDIGKTMATNIVVFVSTKMDFIKRMLNSVKPDLPDFSIEEEVIEGIFTDKTIVITGTLSQSRPYFAKIVEENGGKVGSSVSKKTDFLLAGENAGSKLDKAKKNNVTVLTEEEFNALFK